MSGSGEAVARAGGPAPDGSTPSAGFGADAPTCMMSRRESRLHSRPVNGRKSSRSGAVGRRHSHMPLERPPATPVSTQKMTGWVKARSSVSHGAGSLISTTDGRETVVREQATQAPIGDAVHPPLQRPPKRDGCCEKKPTLAGEDVACCNAPRSATGVVR